MEDDIIVVSSLGQSREILAGFGGMVVVKFDCDGALKNDVSDYRSAILGPLPLSSPEALP